MKYTNSNTFRISFVCLFILFFGLISASITHADDNGISVNVVSTSFQYQEWGQYPLINFLGEKDVPLFANTSPIWKSHVEKPAKLLLDSKDLLIVKSGETLDLGCGYGLLVKQINVSDSKVWLEFYKGGQFVDDRIVSVNYGGDNTWTCTLDNIQGEDNVPVLKVHVYKLLKGKVDTIVLLDGLWLIDFANVKQIGINNQYGSYKVKAINSGVDASNLGSLIFISYSPSPYADFNTSTSGDAPLKVSFTDTSKETPTSWYWDFGDRTTSADQNPTHTYAETGNYQVILTVSNANGTTTNSHLVAVANGQRQNKTTEQLTPKETSTTTATETPKTMKEETTPAVTPTVPTSYISVVENPNFKFIAALVGLIASLVAILTYIESKREKK